MLADEERKRIVQEVEKTLLHALEAGAPIDEHSFLKGAMAGFLAVYGEVDGALPLAPPKWVLRGMVGESIFGERMKAGCGS